MPIRNNMLAGLQMPDKCKICYEREEEGGESARQFESLEWAIHLKLSNKQDLKKIEQPVLYEIRPSNKCNIMNVNVPAHGMCILGRLDPAWVSIIRT
jgi:hypothetical protein